MIEKSKGQHFLQSSAVRKFSRKDLMGISEAQAFWIFCEFRWGSKDIQACQKCGDINKHYFKRQRLQFVCKSCFSQFSPTSGTIFHKRKLKYGVILDLLLTFSTAQKGIAALHVANYLGLNPKTVSVIFGKLREMFVRLADSSPMSGNIEVDGGWFGGKPRDRGRKVPADPKVQARYIEENLKTGKTFVPKYKKSMKSIINLKNRRLIFVLRKTEKGKGASRTLIFIAMKEDEKSARKIISRMVEAGSIVQTDENPCYNYLSAYYDHRTVVHSKEYVTIDGDNENQAESYFSRLRRNVFGVTHGIRPTYCADYAYEMVWREDVRRRTNKEKIKDIFTKINAYGKSIWWRGYWQGNKRGRELTIDELFGIWDAVRV
jgi:transposase-like protein